MEKECLYEFLLANIGCTLCECVPLVVRASDGTMYSLIGNVTEPEIDL